MSLRNVGHSLNYTVSQLRRLLFMDTVQENLKSSNDDLSEIRKKSHTHYSICMLPILSFHGFHATGI
jgi:hypothetical protein